MIGSFIARRLSAAGTALMTPPADLAFDFSQPRGEPALTDVDSLSWRIFRNPVSLFIGGVAAVILELAEPSVRSGVWDHSSFRRDAVTRLRRTGFAAMMTVYGPRRAAKAMIARVVTMHARVDGLTPDGRPYRANDPRLLDWVQATASFGFIRAYHQFVAPLSDEEQSQAFAEGAAAAQLYGALGAPTSLSAWHDMLRAAEPGLESSPIIFEFLDILRDAPVLPAPLRPIQRLLIRAAVEMTPVDVRRKLGLGRRYGLPAGGATTVRLLARIADRLPQPDAPPAQAAIRMGAAPA